MTSLPPKMVPREASKNIGEEETNNSSQLKSTVPFPCHADVRSFESVKVNRHTILFICGHCVFLLLRANKMTYNVFDFQNPCTRVTICDYSKCHLKFVIVYVCIVIKVVSYKK